MTQDRTNEPSARTTAGPADAPLAGLLGRALRRTLGDPRDGGIDASIDTTLGRTLYASTTPLVDRPIPRPAGFPLDEVISVVHSKGGAGKSSLVTNVSYALAQMGYRVLVIDLDRQAGQRVGFGVAGPRLDRNGRPMDAGAVLRGEVALDDAVLIGVHPCLDLLPADERSMAEAEAVLANEGADGRIRLAQVLHEAERRWDVVLVDTPGRKTGIVDVALAASTGVLIPAVPEGGPIAELPSVLDRVLAAQALYGQLEVYGIVRVRVGGASRYRVLAEEQTKAIAAAYDAPVLRNKIPEDARFGEAHLAREPIGVYSPAARSAIAYRFVADELAVLRSWPTPGRAGFAGPDAPPDAPASGAPSVVSSRGPAAVAPTTAGADPSRVYALV